MTKFKTLITSGPGRQFVTAFEKHHFPDEQQHQTYVAPTNYQMMKKA